ncbi:alpha/beta hydrolase family protein (plasmid) [Rhizobium phaseoli]|uniref:alpha/beta fold hydrolase n=1 Tax=Rhizobium phaseoli TaxID=396 RepID=UPI0007EA4156|nr:alpha/beta hydrolase [Rhizobium phaseoli]ANL51029.1 alpha/beta hydrolase family protein [Rhizobium phaseoli]
MASRIVGNGPIHVIALHGWMGDHRLYEPTFELWDRARLTIAFLDCRGYGRRLDEAGDFTIEEVAADVRALARSLGWQRYHVIGHSMTGMTVQRLTVDAREEIESIVMVAALPASGAKITDERRKLLENAITDPEVRRTLIDVNTGHTRSPAWVESLRDTSLAGTSAKPLVAYMSSWTGTDFSGEVVGNTTPVLAILGKNDPGSSIEKTMDTVGTWYRVVEVEVLADAGHYPMYEAPAAFVVLVQRHLSSVSSGRVTVAPF